MNYICSVVGLFGILCLIMGIFLRMLMRLIYLLFMKRLIRSRSYLMMSSIVFMGDASNFIKVS